MNPGYRGAENSLDAIRHAKGIDACKSFCMDLIRSDRKKALAMMNDGRLSFGSLFLLSYEIHQSNLIGELNPRSLTALKICGKILNGKTPTEETVSLQDETTHAALLWMFRTGVKDDGLSNDFDQVLDITASILIKNYKEKSVLPLAADLLFERNRKGTFRQDLAWALFRSHDPDVLRFVAEYLRSADPKDIELAHFLLDLPETGNSDREKQQQYRSYLSWLRENRPFLYFTGESFNRTNQPNLCSIDLGAKYLGKNISPHSRKPVDPWTESEQTCLGCFRDAKEEDKKLLSAYSHQIRAGNPNYWNRWIRLPVEEQIRIAAENRREKR